LIIQEINVRFAKAAEQPDPTKARDHRIAGGLRLQGARLSIREPRWPGWLSKNIRRPRQEIDAALALVEKPGEEIYYETAMPLYLLHEPYQAHSRTVLSDMRRLG